MQSFLKKSWVKLVALFKQGLSPRDLALSIVVSLLVTVFPFLGLDTIVLTSIALPMRLNLPIMIAISYIATPLKFLLLIPFINFGGSIFGANHTLLTLESITESFNSGFFSAIKSLFYELLYGFIGWFVFAIPVAIIAFYLLKIILMFLLSRKV